MVIEYARALGPEFGAVAQLVRVPDCRSGGCGFESRPPRFGTPPHAGFSLRTMATVPEDCAVGVSCVRLRGSAAAWTTVYKADNSGTEEQV